MKTINEVELATNLAHNAASDEMIAKGVINKEDEMFVSLDEQQEVYTEEAQDVFNRHYDYFLNEIENCSE